jgi:hypothetical protein
MGLWSAVWNSTMFQTTDVVSFAGHLEHQEVPCAGKALARFVARSPGMLVGERGVEPLRRSRGTGS